MTHLELLAAIEALIDESRRRGWMEAAFLLEMVLLEATEKTYEAPVRSPQDPASLPSVAR